MTHVTGHALPTKGVGVKKREGYSASKSVVNIKGVVITPEGIFMGIKSTRRCIYEQKREKEFYQDPVV